jgi:hypothetical protein
MHLLQRSTHFSKTCCRPLIISKFLASELPFHDWKSPEIAWGEIWTVWRMSTCPFFPRPHRIQLRSRPMRFLGFSNHEKGAQTQEISKLSTVCSTFSRSGWSVVRSASPAKGGTSKRRPSPHLYKVPIRCNDVSPRTLQTAVARARPWVCKIRLKLSGIWHFRFLFNFIYKVIQLTFLKTCYFFFC